MLAKALESWQGCFNEGDEFEVLEMHNQYILIKENNGRLVWNYIKEFELIGVFEEKTKIKVYKFKVNWNII